MTTCPITNSLAQLPIFKTSGSYVPLKRKYTGIYYEIDQVQFRETADLV